MRLPAPLRRLIAASLLALLPVAGAQARAAEPVLVFAAASLKNALDAATQAWRAETGGVALGNYASSSALARQIEQGAPADIFISADLAWMNDLADEDLIDPATRWNLLGNSLVLIAPAPDAAPIDIVPGVDLLGALDGGRLALGEVRAVPAGRYARSALQHLGIWPSVEDHLAEADSVRGALAFVARGEALLGIVYATDAQADPAVMVVGTFPHDSHPPIVYPVARVMGSDNPDARAFLEFLRSARASAIFEAQGFTVFSTLPG